MKKYIVPFQMEIVPITKLMLVNFEKKPDELYNGLEFQYLKTQEEGSGYRMIAYRIDGYVDVYDEESLHIKDPGAFEVCGNGLASYQKTNFKTKEFVLTEEGIHIEFSFYDVKKRFIDVRVIEHSKRKSKHFDMIAPVGVSSKNPKYFPLYTMYHFDFVRRKNTEISVKIDDTAMTPDKFPLLKEGQRRYFTRYGYDCELFNIGTKRECILPSLILDEANHIITDDIRYQFDKRDGVSLLSSMEFMNLKHKFIFRFKQPFPNINDMQNGCVNGEFEFQLEDTMGVVGGIYKVEKKGSKVEIELIPSEGWKAVPNTFVTRILFRKNMLFCKWPKSYRYHQSIDLTTKQSSCSWERI